MKECSPLTMCHMSPVTCHVSSVMCHMSPFTCHMFFFVCFYYTGGARRLRVSCRWGLPRLVQKMPQRRQLLALLMEALRASMIIQISEESCQARFFLLLT